MRPIAKDFFQQELGAASECELDANFISKKGQLGPIYLWWLFSVFFLPCLRWLIAVCVDAWSLLVPAGSDHGTSSETLPDYLPCLRWLMVVLHWIFHEHFEQINAVVF